MRKSIKSFAVLGLFAAVNCYAASTATNMESKWNCTTNASSAANDTQKAADDKMASTVSSASSAFTHAAKNCRDCTKITCEVKD